MSTYVMSDIHGCYDRLMEMLRKIEFCDEDRLIIAGDYIDRGSKTKEMLEWISKCPDNIILLRGNHDEEFAYSIELLTVTAKNYELNVDDYRDTCLTYELMKGLSEQNGNVQFFDHYGTIEHLVYEYEVTLGQLMHWSSGIRNMPFVFKASINGRECVVVHAGYVDDLENCDTEETYENLDEFYMYARDDAYIVGGVVNGMVIAGHTPTIFPEEFPYNEGKVYRMYDEAMNCIFYNIDCGCAYNKYPQSKLACLRVDDEAVFYV